MALSLSAAVLANVRQQFDSLNSSGERLAVEVPPKGQFSDHRYSVFHKHAGQDNHFQGGQRIGDSNHLLISGSYPYQNPRADLFVLRLGTKANDAGPWGSNLMRSRDPKSADALVNYFKMDSEYWHPGGLSLLGSVLAVPLENGQGGQSKVVFYDMSNPEQPEALPDTTQIARNMHKAGACALTRLPKNDHFLLAVWSDSDKQRPGGPEPEYHLDFYLSTRDDLNQGFDRKPAVLSPDETDPLHKQHQSINLVWQLEENREEPQKNKYTLFLIAFENTSPAQPNPFDPGKNKAYLFEVKLPDGWFKNPPEQRDKVPTTRFITEKSFECERDWANMDAASGLYVDSNQHLIVYSSYHFRTPLRKTLGKQKFVVKTLEFRAIDFSDKITSISDAWLELYHDTGLKGRRLTIIGPWDASIGDYGKIRANDKKFKKAKSARFQIPEKLAYVLYRKKHFAGDRPLVLLGDGRKHELHDLKNLGFDANVKSSQFLKAEMAEALPNRRIVPIHV